MKGQKDIHSPYVVVLGGNTVRKKLPPTALPDQPDAKVFGVISALKTMKEDLHHLEEEQTKEEYLKEKPKSRFSRMFSQKRGAEKIHMVPSLKKKSPVPLSSDQKVQSDQRDAPLPEIFAKETHSQYGSKYLRSIAKMDYLKSKLAVQLPRHSKIGIAAALLMMTVVLPLISRFTPTTEPKTPGGVVYDGTQALVAHVGKSIILPEGETPLVVVATADDIRRLNVPDAKPGNKILLYQNSGKIVIYDAEGDVVLGVVNRSQP